LVKYIPRGKRSSRGDTRGASGGFLRRPLRPLPPRRISPAGTAFADTPRLVAISRTRWAKSSGMFVCLRRTSPRFPGPRRAGGLYGAWVDGWTLAGILALSKVVMVY